MIKVKQPKIIILILLVAMLGSFVVPFVASFEPIPVYATDTEYYSGTYYNSVDTTLTGKKMYQELADLITTTHKVQTTYDGLSSAFKKADADPNNSSKILWFYTGTSVSFSGFGSSSGATNREHVWPKNGGDAFPEKSGPGSDAHHLRPTEANLNSTRSSKSFNEVPQTTSNIVKQGGSTSYGNSSNPDSYCYTTSTFFYPAEGYRGATARILLYMYVRWGTQYNLTFVDAAGGNKTIGKISTLLKWHYQEEPSAEEIYRNEAVFKIQGNRNPFIDHPEWATTILCDDTSTSYYKTLQAIADEYNNYDGNNSGSGGGTTTPTLEYITPSTYNLTLVKGASQKITITTTPSTVANTVTWSSNNTNVAKVDANGNVTAVAQGSAKITATSTVDPTKQTYITVDVKTPSSLTVTGTPTTTTYTDGQAFDPSGLSVSVVYSDGTEANVPLTSCQWLDATTNGSALKQGTTVVLCKYGDLTYVVTGITVSKANNKTITIDYGNFTNPGAYGFYDWASEDGLSSGSAFFYGSGGDLQFSNKKASYYLQGETPSPIVSLTVYLNSGTEKEWEVLTSPTSFGEVSGAPTTGNSWGKKTANGSGVTWELAGNTDNYFALVLTNPTQGACIISKIEITYGSAATVDPDPTPDTVTLNKTTATMETSDTLELTATASGDVTWLTSNSQIATVSDSGLVTALSKGTVTITAICGNATASCAITITTKPCATHTPFEIVDTQATCTTQGSKRTECSVCGLTLSTDVIPTTAHAESGWIVDTQATCMAQGSKHTKCTVCQVTVQTQTIAKLDHNLSDWQTTIPACVDSGEQERHCTNNGCDYAETQVVDPIGHVESAWIVDIRANCTTEGERHTECINCGTKMSTEVLPKEDHVESQWIVVTEASCTQEGFRYTQCLNCDATINTQDVAQLEHSFGEWTVTTQPTTSTNGEQTRTCTTCGLQQTKPLDALLSTDQFVTLVDSINANLSLAQQFEKIQKAFGAYNTMSDEQKQQVASSYAKLKDCATAYNNAVDGQNQTMTNTFNIVVSAFSITLYLAIAFALVFKKFF